MQVPSNYWYPLLQSREVRKKPLQRTFFGQRWVIWRDERQEVVLQSDRCPHLGAALSLGQVREGLITCPFHGFAFDGSGTCKKAPAIGSAVVPSHHLRLQTPLVRDYQGFIWLWHGDPNLATETPPFFEDLLQGWSYGTIDSDWPVHLTRAIENQLDVAHLPFVHANTIGKGHKTLVEGPYVEKDDQEIRVWVSNQKDHGQRPRTLESLALAAKERRPELVFKFPGIWLLNISPKLKLLVAFVPIDATLTRFYVRSYHKFRLPILSAIVSWGLGLSNRFILNEDKRVVCSLTPNSSLDGEDHPLGCDRAILAFRKWYRSGV